MSILLYFAARTRYAWKITPLAWLGLAALVLHAGRGDLGIVRVPRIIGIALCWAG